MSRNWALLAIVVLSARHNCCDSKTEDTPGLEWTCLGTSPLQTVNTLGIVEKRVSECLQRMILFTRAVLESEYCEQYGKLWHERVWKAAEEPLAVVVQSEGLWHPFSDNSAGYEYPCEDSSSSPWWNLLALPHPWGSNVIGCKRKKDEGIELVASICHKVCIGTIFRARRVPCRLRFVGERFNPIYPIRLVLGLVCWCVNLASILLARCFLILAFIYATCSVLKTRVSLSSLLWTSVSDQILSASLLLLLYLSFQLLLVEIKWWYYVYFGTVYDHSRGFYVKQGQHTHQCNVPVTLLTFRTVSYMFYKGIGLMFLVSSDPDRPTALGLAALVLVGLPIIHHSWNSCFQINSNLSFWARRPVVQQVDKFTHRRQVAEHTEASLDALRIHLQTSEGKRDMARLANHPHYAAMRDEQLRHFLRTGYSKQSDAFCFH